VRLALLMLLCLRGTPVLYQGDEVGMPDVAVAQDDLRDPLGVRFYPYYEGRDAARTPMQWSDDPGGGFTDGGRPWLPLGDLATANVRAQRDDPDSVLSLCHDVIAFRRRHPAFATGDTTTLATPEQAWAWTRGPRHAVVLNMSESGLTLPGLSGRIEISTDRARDREGVDGDLRLAASEGVILERPPRTGTGTTTEE
jgi:alpha-glucosidase